MIIFIQGILFLPVLDRDEARFASATQNMLQTSDFIDIEIEGEKRYKKPIGIYWAQALSTSIFGSEPFNQIWTYRIPSFLAIFSSLLLIFFSVRRVYGDFVASFSTLLLSCSFLLISEMHQAKSDALLFLFINICNFLILESIKNNQTQITKIKFTLFWISLSLGTLTKGPIIFLFVILPILIFFFITRSRQAILFLKNKTGYIIYFAIVLPWFILITLKSDWLFWRESLGHDLFKKVLSSQESHGFIPGYYFISFYIFFWPGCLYIIPAIQNFFSKIKTNRIKKDNLFLICVILPAYLIYELIPTKLPHYILGLYPAVSILISNFLDENKKKELFINNLHLVLFSIFPLTIIISFIYAFNQFSEFKNFFVFIIFTYLAIFFFSIKLYIKRKFRAFVLSCIMFQIFNYLSIVHFLNPNLDKLWIAKKISSYVESYEYNNVYHFGFNEPSLVFMIGSNAKRTNPNVMLNLINNSSNDLFIISGKEANQFLEYSKKNKKFKHIESFEGYNYSKGKYILTSIFESDGSSKR